MLTIYGMSDDIVCANIELQVTCPHCGAEVEEPSNAVVGSKEDEIGCYDQKIHFTIGSQASGLVVTMVYVQNGCWGALVHQVAEGVRIPWVVKVESRVEDEHSVCVLVDCPSGTPVKVEKESTS